MYLFVLFYYIASLFNSKARKITRGQRESLRLLLGKTTMPVPDIRGCIWFHAASVGEFEQARPIIERLKREQPERKVLITFFSCSGYEMRKDYPLADLVLYLPFATRRNARLFIKAVQPEMALFVKYEYWPAYLRELNKQNIKTYIIDAIYRERQPFFRWYGAPYRRLLRLFTILFVQDERSRELLDRYGIRNTIVAGDTRFDRVNAICQQHKQIDILEYFVQPEITPLTAVSAEFPMPLSPVMPSSQPRIKVIVAGSTWPPDEQLLERYVHKHTDVKLVLVPHELTDEHMHHIFNLFEGRFVRMSEANRNNLSLARVLLVDKMGLLSSIYQYATVAYVGGGFGVGIHNTIEPAVFGVPVLFGPNNKKFREAQDMLERGAAFTFNNYTSFEKAMDEALLHSDDYGKRAGEYVQAELGAADTIYNATLSTK